MRNFCQYVRWLLFSHFNLSLERTENSHNLFKLARELEIRSISIDTVFDIGANSGDWSVTFRKLLKNYATFVLFEPNENFAENYRRNGFKYFSVLLSDKEKEVQFFSNKGTGDSYYREIGSDSFKNIEPIVKVTKTLDSIIQSHNLDFAQLIKLDTQGSELDILRGSPLALANAKVILIECPVLRYNEGAPNLQSYLDFFSSNNYAPFELTEVHIANGRLVQIDLAFINLALNSN